MLIRIDESEHDSFFIPYEKVVRISVRSGPTKSVLLLVTDDKRYSLTFDTSQGAMDSVMCINPDTNVHKLTGTYVFK